MARRLRRLGRGCRHEGGQALLFVLIAVTLLASVPIAIATTTIGQLPQTTRNLSYEAAYEAAQAGLSDYVQHLDANESYGLYCKTCASGTAGNPAFSSWVQAASSPPEYYSYAPTNTSGLGISLIVSGKAGTGATAVVRTFSYLVKPASSLNDVYWSNYETRDPAIGALWPGAPSGYQDCDVHYDQADYHFGDGIAPATGPPESACEVVFQTGDVLNGPIFSDDTFRMCGTPVFDSTVQSGNIYNTATGDPGIFVASNGCGSNSPSFLGARSKIGNQTPRTASDDLAPARNFGCFITGGTAPSSLSPVNITMTLTVSGATTKVAWSPTSGTPVIDNAGTNANSCTSPITVSNLTSGIIFVNGNVTISGQMTGGLDVVTCSTTTDALLGNCNSAATSNIIIGGGITYPAANKVMVSGQPTSDTHDALGLIAENSVEVATTSTVEIDAAILALDDSFYVNNWFGGASYGTLNVFGSIAQNFRGPVGQSGGIGYVKNYNYDTSLQTVFPPFFIPPNGATWGPSSYEECGTGPSKSVISTTSNGC